LQLDRNENGIQNSICTILEKIIYIHYDESEDLPEVTMKHSVVWVVTPCNLEAEMAKKLVNIYSKHSLQNQLHLL
jgi:hypothetical protein